MNYTELLNKLIDESGKMLKDIAAECTEKYNVKLTNNYLSILKTTSGRIPADDISRAIAKACNAPYEEILVVQAYLDKAPQILIDFIETMKKNNDIGVDFFEMMGAENNKAAALILSSLKVKAQQSLAEFICETVTDAEDTDDSFQDFQSQMEKARKIQENKWLVIPPEGAKGLLKAKYIDESDIKKIIKIDPAE